MNTKHLFAAALGIAAVTAQVRAAELLTNGTFTGGTSAWTLTGDTGNAHWEDTKAPGAILHSTLDDGATDTQGYLWYVHNGTGFTATQSVTVGTSGSFVLSGQFQQRDDSDVPGTHSNATFNLSLLDANDVELTPNSTSGSFPGDSLTNGTAPDPAQTVTRSYTNLPPGTYKVQYTIAGGQGASDNLSLDFTASGNAVNVLTNGTFTGGTTGWTISGDYSNTEWSDTTGLHSTFEDGAFDGQGYLWYTATNVPGAIVTQSITVGTAGSFVLSGQFQQRDDVNAPGTHSNATFTLSLLDANDLVLTPDSTSGTFPVDSLINGAALDPAQTVTRSYINLPAGTYKVQYTIAGGQGASDNLALDFTSTATDYDTWKSDNGVIGGENDDDDNDGLTNGEEYAFGLDPTGGTSVNPITVQLNKTDKTFSYTRRDTSKTDLTYTVWFSTDLAGWTQDTSAAEGTPVLSGEVETVQVTLSNLPGDPLPDKLFIQVRAN